MTNLTDLLTKFMNSNTASTSGSGTLPSNTITNLKVDLKGITTRSGVAYQGPTIPTTSSSPPKVVERETEFNTNYPEPVVVLSVVAPRSQTRNTINSSRLLDADLTERESKKKQTIKLRGFVSNSFKGICSFKIELLADALISHALNVEMRHTHTEFV
ncbi:hypothetical protein Tco_0878269 [Tanacetum coccineum]|uniref:Reverse transcriptase domain-containing protein n=1 Tax=Tanacetum coccineum TaxID=301880 RepID=A0ABQ5C0U5_9ASTR